MEYDFRKRTGASSGSNMPAYGRVPPAVASSTADARPMFSQTPFLYPQIGGTGSHSAAPIARNAPFHNAPPPPSSSGMGIMVSVKPEYRITQPPTLLRQLGEIPRSNFHFDFEFERNVLIEAVKEKPNWSRLGIENIPPKATQSSVNWTKDHAFTANYGGPTADPILSKHIAAGLSREAVPLAVAKHGDNPSKVKEFASGYTLLREMGFSSNNVAEALNMYENDTDKALAHFLNVPLLPNTICRLNLHPLLRTENQKPSSSLAKTQQGEAQ